MTTRTLELPTTLEHAHAPVSADIGLRAAATAIDLVVVGTVAIAAGLCAHLILLLLPQSVLAVESLALAAATILIAALYFVYFWGYEGATPGQKMLGLCVTRPGTLETRQPIGVGRAALRLAGFAAGAILLVGLLVAVLRWDRRALHDVIADSIVVPRRS